MLVALTCLTGVSLAQPDTQPRLPESIPNLIKPRIDPLTHVLAPGDVLEFVVAILKEVPRTTAELPRTFRFAPTAMYNCPLWVRFGLAG